MFNFVYNNPYFDLPGWYIRERRRRNAEARDEHDEAHEPEAAQEDEGHASETEIDWNDVTLPILSTIKSLVEFQLCLMAFVVVSVSVQNKLFCMRKVGIAFIYSERLFKHCRYIGGETDRDVTISSKTCPQNMFKHLIYKDTLSIECIVT